MKSVKDMKNNEMIKINGERYQVIRNTSLFFDKNKNKLEMVLELAKIGEKALTPCYRLTYFSENPAEMKFFQFDKKSESWKESDILPHLKVGASTA